LYGSVLRKIRNSIRGSFLPAGIHARYGAIKTGTDNEEAINSWCNYKLTLTPKFKFSEAICCFPFTVVIELVAPGGLLFEKFAVAIEV